MKLLKKLLPVASLVSVAAVAAPLATSCSNTGKAVSYSFSYDAENPEEIAEYEPRFEALPQQTQAGGFDPYIAQQAYFDQMSKDPSLYADDLMCAMYNELLTETEYLDWYDKIDGTIEIAINSFEPSTFKSYEGSGLHHGGYVNGYIKSNYTFSYIYGYQIDGYVNRKITFNNLPIFVAPEEFYYDEDDYSYNLFSVVPLDLEMFDYEKYYKNTSISFVDECKRGQSLIQNDVVWTLDNPDRVVYRFSVLQYYREYLEFDLFDLLHEFGGEYYDDDAEMYLHGYGYNSHYLENNLYVYED